jgi:hypothetical protein
MVLVVPHTYNLDADKENSYNINMKERKYKIGPDLYDEDTFQRILKTKQIISDLQGIQQTIYQDLMFDIKQKDDGFLFDFIYNDVDYGPSVIQEDE